MRIAIVVGTRPEAIKLAPVAELLGPDAFVIHTGQHHTAGMIGHLAPHLVLDTQRDAARGHQLGSMTSALDQLLREHQPDAVIVQGDTTSALAGALAANATGTPLVHVEAGLRSFDRTMPEEHNRVLIDHLADLCCAPTPLAHNNLHAERIPPDRIAVTGNTIVEAVHSALPSTENQVDFLQQLGLGAEPFVLATVHRPENADDPAALAAILSELAALPVPVVLPLHPRTQRQIMQARLGDLARDLRLTGPLDYTALLTLIQHAAVVISDSGGIQEEATVLKRPIMVIRRSNERPEIEGTFGTRLQPGPEISTITNKWLTDLAVVHARLAELPSPYGDGTASTQIIHATTTRFTWSRGTERTLPPTA
ncbi:UDP-N-acetylglucosamine 2-epimerase (non-hydrolyzing) [Saccharopolyspora sp. K220]|uniref:non-hydrolyzing UDP-N-acetylglucosamine 2-epimerase n=1 Tax=Saccharopolyspora soli TaxID=2926618 RepID=UPI001F5AB8BD|nr:UDP-N-acetylglucosamine 2-epimerase (non-hydrolyzing) [Saccharopolyspora soli]MCI2422138.1 UDP-N-acetylglucosamine 2-epimerase (non-hydrolyzing) [Saccharopolyspora soli]